MSQIKGFVNYIDKNTIDINKLNNYKVITVTASTANNDCFGNMCIGEKDEIHSESYISFNVNSKLEAESLFSYLKTRFSNFLLKMRKITHNISENTCKWIPLPPLNKEWYDEDVYKYFKLSEDEIKLIKETIIVGYKDIKMENNEIVEENKLEIIKNGRSNYYLIENKLYKIKKDKTQGEYYSDYIDGEIILVNNISKDKKNEIIQEKKPKKLLKKKIKNDE